MKQLCVYVGGLVAAGLISMRAAGEPVTFVNDTKLPAVIHVVRTDTPSTCSPLPTKHAGSSSNTLMAGGSWQESHGTGCWSWSPGGENFDDKTLSTWCVMKDGGRYRLSADTSQPCRVND